MKKQKGFTLIELLVVIAIIALLMAILIPTLRRAKEQAKKTVCTAHTKGLVLALILYIDDYDGKTHNAPNQGLWDNAHENPPIITKYGPDDGNAYWGIAYYPYAKNKEIFHCPSAIRVDDWPEWGWGKSYQIYFRYCSYGLNNYITDKNINTAFKRHSEVIAFQDHIEQRLDSVGSDMFCIGTGDSINLTQWRGGGTYGDFPDGISECFRHSRSSYYRRHTLPEGYATVEKGLSVTSWLDGHVSEIEETTGEDVSRKWYRGIPD